MDNNTCLVFGATGQDGSFLVEKLLQLGYEVVCGYRKSSSDNTDYLHQFLRSSKYNGQIHLEEFDLSDATSIYRIIGKYQPKWLFNEADQDHVGWSYKIPSYSIQVTVEAVTTICEAVRQYSPETRIFLPVSSNIYGNAHSGAISEHQFPSPVSPYGIAKSAVLYLSRYYRNSYNMNIVTGILFNHESFKRSENYLTKKLAKAVARISLGIDKTVAFGDLDTEVDWGCASEFTRFFCDLMETDYVGDIVIGTGQLTKVQDLVKDAFQYKDLDFRDFVTQDSRFMRPIKMAPIYADTSKMFDVVGHGLERMANQVITEMIDYEIDQIQYKSVS